jgi:hypothetical protein
MILIVERTSGHAADALSDFEDARRHDVGELVSPRLTLEVHAGMQLFLRAKGTDIDVRI